jgi:sulfate/thiosulfate-binding protein
MAWSREYRLANAALLSLLLGSPASAAYGQAAAALKQSGEANARTYMSRLFKNVPVLDTGARGSTTTFAPRKLGDVLLSWENEAYLPIDAFGPNFGVADPSFSILAEPPVALIDKNVDRHKTRTQAEGYLNCRYSPAAQEIIAKRHFRPPNAQVAAKYAREFRKSPLSPIADLGGWRVVQPKHVNDGGVFDQIYKPT